MRSFTALVLIILWSGWLFLDGVNDQSERGPFDNVRFDRPLPQIFRAGEIYVLHGELLNAMEDVIISADLQLLDGAVDYYKTAETKTQHGHFSLALHLKYAGLYNFSLKANYQLLGTHLLKAVVPMRSEPMPLFPVSDFTWKMVDFQPKLVWETQNELVELQIQQDDHEKSLIISNSRGSFQIDPMELQGFGPGEALVRIRGARSADGSWYTIASDWGQWHELPVMLAEVLPTVIGAGVKFNQRIEPIVKVGERLKLDLTIRAYFQPNAYIKRPDGRVDLIRLRSNKPLAQFSVGKEAVPMYPDGRCWLEYIPRSQGSYQIEINDAYGNALINIPFYCGNYLPILPPPQLATPPRLDQFDLQESRNRMLAKINALRQRLGHRSLILDPQLTSLSQYYADRMARENFCAHVAPKDGEVLDGRRRKFKIIELIKENVAKAPNLDQAFYNLIHSPAHYAAMIDSTMNRAGIGIAIDETQHFLLAQHFSPHPYFADQAEDFLASLFQKMKAIRADLVRLAAPPDQPRITSATFHGTSPEKIEQVILSPRGQRIWRQSSIGAIYFAMLVQTVDGFKLEIDFYPRPEQK